MNSESFDSSNPSTSESLAYETPRGRTPGLDILVTRFDVALLGIRFIALYAALTAVVTLVDLIDRGSIQFFWMLGDPLKYALIIYTIAAIVLWNAAPRLAGWMLRTNPPVPMLVPPESSSRPAELLAAGIALMGLWLLVYAALPGLAIDLGQRALQPFIGPFQLGQSYEATARMPAHLVETAAGVFLFLMSRRLAKRWWGAGT